MEHEADLFGPTGTTEPLGHTALKETVGPPAFVDAAGDALLDQPAIRFEFPDPYLEGQQDERRRMGRELHDSTSQLLLALRLSVARLRHAQGIEFADQILIEIDDTVRQIDEELRTFTFLNYPVELGKCGLAGALEALAKGFANRTGIRTDFQRDCNEPCTGELALTLFRIAQEGLMNVHRHAQATRVRIALFEQNKVLELSISDDGRGIPPADHLAAINGVGLQGMRNRIDRLGGRFAVRRLKHGTKLVVTVPRTPSSKAA